VVAGLPRLIVFSGSRAGHLIVPEGERGQWKTQRLHPKPRPSRAYQTRIARPGLWRSEALPSASELYRPSPFVTDETHQLEYLVHSERLSPQPRLR
jgi:hypothetical protein